MKIKLLIWSTDKNASDGSYIPTEVWASYINSDRCKDALDKLS